jgi:hypothetical protein
MVAEMAATAGIAVTAGHPMVVHRPEDRTAGGAIQRRRRIAQALLEEAMGVEDRMAVLVVEAPMEASAADRMAVPAGARTGARVVVLTEAIAEAKHHLTLNAARIEAAFPFAVRACVQK